MVIPQEEWDDGEYTKKHDYGGDGDGDDDGADGSAYPKKHEYESIDDRLEESKTGADTCDCKAEQRKLPPEQINIYCQSNIYRFSFQLKYTFRKQGCRKKSM